MEWSRCVGQTVCELMQYLQAANWMRLSLPSMTEEARTKRVASRKVISEEDCLEEIQAA